MSSNSNQQPDTTTTTATATETEIGTISKKLNEWENYFFAIAFLASKRSEHLNNHVGCCIVSNEEADSTSTNRVVSVGYNGMMQGYKREGLVLLSENNAEYYECCAEMNAFLHSNKVQVEKCVMYCTHEPCNSCKHFIIRKKLSKVFYIFGETTKVKYVDDTFKQVDFSQLNQAVQALVNYHLVVNRSNFDVPAAMSDNSSSNQSGSQAIESGTAPEPQRMTANEYLLGFAVLTASLSKLEEKASNSAQNEKEKRGCIIARDKHVVSIGYATKTAHKGLDDLSAELNALLYSHTLNLQGCVLFTFRLPAKAKYSLRALAQAGIQKVVYWEESDELNDNDNDQSNSNTGEIEEGLRRKYDDWFHFVDGQRMLTAGFLEVLKKF